MEQIDRINGEIVVTNESDMPIPCETLVDRILAIGLGNRCQFYVEGPHQIIGVLQGVTAAEAVIELGTGTSCEIPLERICAYGRLL